MPRPKRTGGRAAAGGGQMSREIGGFVVTIERQGRQWRIEAFNGEQAWSKLVANPLGRITSAFLREVGLSRKEIEEYRHWVERLMEPDKEEQEKRGRRSEPPRRKMSTEGAFQQQAAEAARAENAEKAEEPPKVEDVERKAEEGQASEGVVVAVEAASGGAEVPSAAEALGEPTAGKAPQKSGEPSAEEAAPEPFAPQREELPPKISESAAQGEASQPPGEAQRGQPAEAARSPKAEEAAEPPSEAEVSVESEEPPKEEAEGTAEAEAVAEASEERPSEPPPSAAEGQGICGEEGAQAFVARDLAVLVKLVKGPRGRNKYEVKVKRLADCSIIDIIPEVGSPTSREVDRMLRKAGLTPDEVAKFVEWVRGLGSKRPPDREEVASTFRRVVESARSALSSRLDSPYLDLLIPKRDKETLTNCRPAECWRSANAAAIVPASVAEVFGILDLDSAEAVKEAKDLGFDSKQHMHITSGPAVDAVLTPEGKWRTPDGQVLDDVPRRLHIPIYIPEGCLKDLKARGLEVKCRQPINIAGRHPSGAAYEFVDGELLVVPWRIVEEFAVSLGAKIPGYSVPPECEVPKGTDVDKLTSLFQRIYTAAQAAGYSRHDAIYDLATLGRFACVDKESIKEVVRRVYGTTGDESQTLSQRLTHVERAYRASPFVGPWLRSPQTIYNRWLGIDKEAAEEIFKILGLSKEEEDVIASECLTWVKLPDGTLICEQAVVARRLSDDDIMVYIRNEVCESAGGDEGKVVCKEKWKTIYRGPRPKRIHDIARQKWFYEIGGFYGLNPEQVVEKIRQARSKAIPLIKTNYLDEFVTVLNQAAEEKEVALTVGLLPTKNGVILVDDHGILDLGPSPEEAVADLDKALRSILAAYPEANHDPALASVGYILGLNAAPVWWFHRPNSEVPLPIVYGASSLGKSELMRRVVEPAVVGLEAKNRVGLIREKIVDETLHDYLAPDVYKIAVYSTSEQFRNELDTNTLVLILDEQKPGDPRNPRASAKIFGSVWLQVSTAEWGRKLSQHAARYGGGFGYKFFRQRAFAIITNYSPDEWKRAGLAEAVSAEGAIDRRIFEIPWEDQKLDDSKVNQIYKPRYSILKALEITVNKHFAELTAQSRFADFVIALWRKVVEDFEPKLGRLDGIRRMIEALERLAQYNLEKNRLRDPVVAAREELRRNALAYLREEAKISDLSPAKFVGKVVEYAAELGLVFRKPRWADEVNAARVGFCKALANAVDIPDYDCEDFATLEIEGHDNPAGAPLFNQIVNKEMREALWSVFTNYAAKGYTPSVLAGSVLWPKNTKTLGRIPRTSWKRPDGTVEYYYKLTWQEFFETFVGQLIASEQREVAEGAGQMVSGGEVVSPLKPSTNIENQATNIETAPPISVDSSKAQSELTTLTTLTTDLPKGINSQNEFLRASGAVEKQEESGEQAPAKSAEAPPAPPAASDAKAATSEASWGQKNLAPVDPAAACMSNPICGNRLKLCIWRHLKVPGNEKKKALYAEIERRGELFAHCIKDAVEYAERESKR